MKTIEAQEAATPAKLVRGKYSNLLKQGTNVVILDPALVDQFPDSESVNDALHAFLSLPEEKRAAALRQARENAPRVEYEFDPRVGKAGDGFAG